jgi:hypothetical protein
MPAWAWAWQIKSNALGAAPAFFFAVFLCLHNFKILAIASTGIF